MATDRPATQRISLLMQAASTRLIGALALVALLWVAVAWALGDTP